jgi:putative cardiolipin synthase
VKTLRFVGALVVLLGVVGCARLQARPDLPPEAVAAAGSDTDLDGRIAPAEAAHPGRSGFRLISDGQEAFVVRERSAAYAGRSLDVQTYIWHADTTGLLLAQSVLEAADRGVRVRLLVDDMDARAKNSGFAALAAHPNIKVRLFNPLASRRGPLGLLGEWLTSFDRVNHRMHNKAWIADNRIAVVGGRNLGDEYFGAGGETNFVDLDFALVGPVVREVSASFDLYWNSPSAYPMELLDPSRVNADALENLRPLLLGNTATAKEGHFASLLNGDDGLKRLLSGDWPLEWASEFQFVADDPLKVSSASKVTQEASVSAALEPLLQGLRNDAAIISPYFVPGKGTTATFVKAARAGKSIRILTNSLLSNDVAAVHGAYSRYRRPLLAGGVQLWEMKPRMSGRINSSVFGSSGASLHTKALVVDGSTVFVGSYNIDPRSTWINCEQGVLVRDTRLAAQLTAIFAAETDGGHAWRVTLRDGSLEWSDGTERFRSDPKATVGQRLQAWLVRMLHIDAHL